MIVMAIKSKVDILEFPETAVLTLRYSSMNMYERMGELSSVAIHNCRILNRHARLSKIAMPLFSAQYN